MSGCLTNTAQPWNFKVWLIRLSHKSPSICVSQPSLLVIGQCDFAKPTPDEIKYYTQGPRSSNLRWFNSVRSVFVYTAVGSTPLNESALDWENLRAGLHIFHLLLQGCSSAEADPRPFFIIRGAPSQNIGCASLSWCGKLMICSGQTRRPHRSFIVAAALCVINWVGWIYIRKKAAWVEQQDN